MPLFNFDFTGVSSARKEAEQARREEYTQRAEYYKALAEKNNFDRLESMRLSAGNYTPKEISDMDLKSSESTKNYAQAQDYRSQALSRAPYNDPLTRDKTSAEVSLTMAQARSANSKAALEEEEVENQRAYGNSVKNYVATMQNFGEQIGQAEGELASLRIARKQDPQNMTLIAAEAGVVRKIEGLNTAKAVMDKTFLVESMQVGKEGSMSAFAQMSGVDPKSLSSGQKKASGSSPTFKYRAKRQDPSNPEAYEEIEADLPVENLSQMQQMLPYGAALRGAYSPDYANPSTPAADPIQSNTQQMFAPAMTGNEPIQGSQLFGPSGQTNAPTKPKFFFDPQSGKLMQR